MKMLYIRWLDSAITYEWSHGDGQETGLTEIESIGYLLKEDKEHIQIAQSNFADFKFGAIQAIPKSVILERRELEVVND